MSRGLRVGDRKLMAESSMLSAFFRQGNHRKELENFYMVGGSVHPEGGIPLVILSGKITAGVITERYF